MEFDAGLYEDDPELMRAIQASLEQPQPQVSALDDVFIDVPLEEKKEKSTNSSSHGALHNNTSCDSGKNTAMPSAATTQ